jgi:hypothetical protein
MTKRRVLLVALLLAGILVFAQPKSLGADDGKKAPDALQTVKAFLNLAFTGQAKVAAELGEPGKSYSRERKINEDFGKVDAKKPPDLVSLHADDEAALAITQPVVTKDKRQAGPLSIRLIKKNERWLVRDVDIGKDRAAKNLKRFQRERPKAKVVIPKEDK